MLVPLTIPFGVFRNGTQYAAKNRWFDTSLVRWHDGALRSIGGWARRLKDDSMPIESLSPLLDPTEIFRDSIAWSTNTDSLAIVFGSDLNLRYLNPAGVLTTITPAGFNSGGVGAGGTGFGGGAFGSGAFGVTVAVAPAITIPRWRFDTWGEDLIAMNSGEGLLYAYSTGDAAAVIIPNAPVDLIDAVVTNERIVMAVGGTLAPRQVIWSDQEDYNNWTSLETNHAGSITLSGSGEIVCIHRVLNLNLILTETDAFTARYTGPPYIYRFDRIAENVKPASADAVVTTTTFAVWLGSRNFWIFDGSVRELKCDVIDYLMDDVDMQYTNKVYSRTNTDFSEIWWYYQSNDGDEVDSYVVYNYENNFWYIGKLQRNAGLDRGSSDVVIEVDQNGYIYNAEQANIKVEGATYAETGPIEIGNGDKNMVIREVFLDTTRFGALDVTFYGRAMPSATEYTYGPYMYNNPTPVRVQGREVRMRLDGLVTKWEAGTMRVDIVKGSGR